MSKWQPIETAPMDGTAVLVYAAPWGNLPGFQDIASWHKEAGWCVDELREVTHWMSLPEPPEGDSD